MQPLVPLLVLITFLLGPLALAKESSDHPHWLDKEEVRAIEMQEPPPPAAGSPADQADRQTVLAAQSGRTPAQIAEAQGDASYSVALFTSIIGPQLTPSHDPLTFRLFERLNKEVSAIVTQSKENWKRLRPYQAHPEIHPLFEAGGYSYPSGHATHSYTFAVILGSLFPDHAEDFLQRAHLIAQSRVDAGVHYPTDIQEGETLGRAIARMLLTKPDFQRELQAAKSELAGKTSTGN